MVASNRRPATAAAAIEMGNAAVPRPERTMATKKITTYEYSCDLCGQVCQEIQARGLKVSWSAMADAHLNLGNELRARNKLNEAIASYRKAISLAPRLAAANLNLGTALFDRGQYPEAAAFFRDIF